MLKYDEINGDMLITYNIPVEYPQGENTKVVVGRNEFILGRKQTKIWRKIGENDEVSVNELREQLIEDGLEISEDELKEVVCLFLNNELLVEREEAW